jgi:hypothetical protein
MLAYMCKVQSPVLGKKKKLNWVAQACNPSYLGGRDQEDHSSKPAWANSLRDPILKIPIIKKGQWSGSRYRPRVQASVLQKKKKVKTKEKEEIHS